MSFIQRLEYALGQSTWKLRRAIEDAGGSISYCSVEEEIIREKESSPPPPTGDLQPLGGAVFRITFSVTRHGVFLFPRREGESYTTKATIEGSADFYHKQLGQSLHEVHAKFSMELIVLGVGLDWLFLPGFRRVEDYEITKTAADLNFLLEDVFQTAVIMFVKETRLFFLLTLPALGEDKFYSVLAEAFSQLDWEREMRAYELLLREHVDVSPVLLDEKVHGVDGIGVRIRVSPRRGYIVDISQSVSLYVNFLLRRAACRLKQADPSPLLVVHLELETGHIILHRGAEWSVLKDVPPTVFSVRVEIPLAERAGGWVKKLGAAAAEAILKVVSQTLAIAWDLLAVAG